MPSVITEQYGFGCHGDGVGGGIVVILILTLAGHCANLRDHAGHLRGTRGMIGADHA
jgi:hypothetical protein